MNASRPSLPPARTAPQASVIIPAYRAHATLPAVLDALEPQIVSRDREVVLVDSTGANSGLRIEREWPWVRVLSLRQRTLPGRARNLGVSISRGSLLAFLDADTIPSPAWLDELEQILRPGIDLVAGSIVDGTPDSPWGATGYLLEFLDWVPERQTALGHAAGCNLLMRRERFDQTGGFPEDLWPGEDTVFSVPFAMKGTLAFAPRARVTHLNRTSVRAVLAHQRRLGTSWVEVCARAPVPGGRLGVSPLAPVAVLGRVYSLIKQLRRYPGATRRLVQHGPRLAVGLVAWGVGVARPPRGHTDTRRLSDRADDRARQRDGRSSSARPRGRRPTDT